VCSCDDGYLLQDDGRTCEGLVNNYIEFYSVLTCVVLCIRIIDVFKCACICTINMVCSVFYYS